MDDKLNNFLTSISFNQELDTSSLKIDKVVLKRSTETFEVYLTSSKPIEPSIAQEIINCAKKGINGDKSCNVYFHYAEISPEDNINCFKYLLKQLIKRKPALSSIDCETVTIDEQVLLVEVSTKVEEDLIRSSIKGLLKSLSSLGYYDLDITTSINKEQNDAIKKAIEDTHKQGKITESIEESPIILGKHIDGETISINDINGEATNIIVEAYVFGKETKNTEKTNIMSLKISDKTNSIMAKFFIRELEDFKAIDKRIKENNWYRIHGNVKYDDFAKDFVLMIRNMEKVASKDSKIIDDYPEKRVELHAHTKFSQMDGIIDPKTLVKTAIAWGHKGIAITDHNGGQAYPDVFRTVTDYNKGKADEDKFKAIYGTELNMIDDSVSIVKRGSDLPLIGTTYCVFDLETTGFNAAGGDSIIEIGAVKIKNGEILERFDELINPGHPLNPRITEVTSITDELLKDKDNEENAIKRFITWFGDLPMVAHNARFDTSFLEMAYEHYNLGVFTNTIIDTLELSRALDPGFSRHSLSAVVKRYKVPFDEESHHRGDYDAEGTALVLDKMLKKANDRNFETINSLNNLIEKNEIYKYGESSRINILTKNKVGLKNLFKIISLANTKYLYKTPRILRSEIESHREGLLIGSGCYESEVFVKARSKSDEEMINIINFYDYVEIQPMDAYTHLIESNDFSSNIELENHLKKIVRLTESAGKIMVATGDVHYLYPSDKIYRSIIINQNVPGGGRHPLARYQEANYPNNHFRTTKEMLDDMSFLGDTTAHEIVIDNPNKILDMCDIIEVIPDTGGIPFSPRIRNDEGTGYLDCPVVVTKLVYDKASSWYGTPLPYNIEERIAKELYGDNLFASIKDSFTNSKLSQEEKEKEEYAELHNIILKGKDACLELVNNKLKKDLESSTDDSKSEDIKRSLKKPLGGVIGGGFDPIYLIAQRLVKHSNDAGFLVGSRGSVGSSFVATMMGITEVNPLPPHYRCPKCHKSFFKDDNGEDLSINCSDGFDLPDKMCPDCHIPLIKDGHDMPFATFLGFNADKVPDIDLNFSDLNQADAHAYTKVLFGEDNVYRAGTVGTVADKTAYGYVKGYFEDKNIIKRSIEVERLAIGVTGVKRTTGQHPGGIVVVPDYKEVYDFTPFQYPADDVTSPWRTTHFDYHSIQDCLLKLDILGHSDPTQLRLIQLQSNTDITKVPLDDKDTMKIFTSPQILGVTKEQIKCNTGTLGIPEFGTPFTIQLVEDTKPKTFAELIKISGLAHGTDVWLNNAQLLVKNNVVPFKEVIGCRDDIMVNLISWGMPPKLSFTIMEFVRKGRAVNSKKPNDPETWLEYKEQMKQYEIPDWYIDSCSKIQYMFPKAHACAYVINAYRIAWYKVHMPVYFYASWLSSKATDIDIDAMIGGYNTIKTKIESIIMKGYDATNKENGQHESLNVALEATARGIKFLNVDLYKSDATIWVVASSTEIYPPFSSIDGLGETSAQAIVKERVKPFISIEDLQKRGKLSATNIDKLRLLGVLKDLPETSQLSLF